MRNLILNSSTITLPLTDKTIAIDYTAAYEQGAGIGRLVRDLITHLAKLDTQTDYRLFVAGATSAKLPPAPGTNFTWKPTRITPLWFARGWHRGRLPIPVEAFVGRVALFHATDFTLLPTLPNTKTILTVHDLSYVKVPETAHPAQKAYLDMIVPRSVKRATHVIADSQATKDDLVEIYRTPAAKISVLLSGVNPTYRPIDDPQERREVRTRYGIPADCDYVFSIGTVQPRKNYGMLMDMLGQLKDRFPRLHLVIAGGKGWLEDAIFEKPKQLGIEDRVHFVGFVKDSDVSTLYSDAIATGYISLYEGFGFPVVESMACGTPVVTSNVSSMPEVAGDVALMVNPYDLGEITEAFARLVGDAELRAKLKPLGMEQAKRFTWEHSAQRLLEIYAQVLAG